MPGRLHSGAIATTGFRQDRAAGGIRAGAFVIVVAEGGQRIGVALGLVIGSLLLIGVGWPLTRWRLKRDLSR
jgi:hypothetical protein